MKFILILLTFLSFDDHAPEQQHIQAQNHFQAKQQLQSKQYLQAQQLSDFVVPSNYKRVLETKGDLDKDGIAEIVYAYNTNRQDGKLGFFRILYICKVIDGKVRLWKKNTSVLRSSSDCGFCVDKGIDLDIEIKNNTLVIKQTFNHNSRHYSSNQNIFRYQNAGWYLIGSTFNEYDTCDFDYKYDINFSTKQVDVALTYGVCDGDEDKKMPEDKYYKFKYAFKSLPKMDDFKPGRIELKIPDSKMFFYY